MPSTASAPILTAILNDELPPGVALCTTGVRIAFMGHLTASQRTRFRQI